MTYKERQGLIDEYVKELQRTLGTYIASTYSVTFINRRFRLNSLLGHITTFTTKELQAAIAVLKARPNA